MNHQTIRKAEIKLVRGLLDLVVLGLLKEKSTHGYGIITSIRTKFGVYFGPSTVYPLLNELEKKGSIKSEWDLTHDRPRKVYSLTVDGSSLLTGVEESLFQICTRLNEFGMNRLRFNSPLETPQVENVMKL
ncbi:MAG: PadR family transcriptional regulator [Candidatus Bathyarchaeota archaeon]|nr:PadR family transcriptional regulator [Candidatus Bathyarchaeota archaeon]